MRSVLAVLVVVGVSACGGTVAGTTTTTNAPATTVRPATTTTHPTTTVTTEPSTTTTTPVVEPMFGELVAFVGEDGTVNVTVALEELLSGDEAVAAAREDGAIGDDETLPNDYYIRDLGQEVTLPVAPDVSVVLLACYENGPCVTAKTVDLDTWSVLLGGEDDAGLEWQWYGAGYLPYWWHVADGTVSFIEEQYLP